MRILVTGGTGFIGSNLVLRLLEQGHEVLITGHDAEQKIPNFRGKMLQPGLLGIDWEALGHVDVLFHLAAINDTTSLDEREMMRANVAAAQELFRRVAEGGCRRIVYASSTAVYGDAPAPYREETPARPLNPYARSKKELEEWASRFAAEHPELTVVGLRYCNVYGPRENHKGPRASMIYQLAAQMRQGNPRLFRFGEQKRDYLYVADAVRANLLAAEARQSCIVNCGSGKAVTFNALVELLNQTLGVRRRPEYIPNPFADRYQSHTECDMTLAKERLGFEPAYDLPAGLADYARSGFLPGCG
ncbi:MAG TPA: NAD-dependent epimerase/dehydratase family protein [Terriglobia bacterium]|nr:NAD-dependent epimerase/dehydratase family protein [Terriglobia bacterium]